MITWELQQDVFNLHLRMGTTYIHSYHIYHSYSQQMHKKTWSWSILTQDQEGGGGSCCSLVIIGDHDATLETAAVLHGHLCQAECAYFSVYVNLHRGFAFIRRCNVHRLVQKIGGHKFLEK